MTELTYIQAGDYRIPNITLRHTDITIGRYGQMRREYLKEHRPILYNDLILIRHQSFLQPIVPSAEMPQVSIQKLF